MVHFELEKVVLKIAVHLLIENMMKEVKEHHFLIKFQEFCEVKINYIFFDHLFAQKMAFDNSVKGQIVKAYNESMTAEEGRLNLMRFDRRLNKLINDPKTDTSELKETMKGLKQIVTSMIRI